MTEPNVSVKAPLPDGPPPRLTKKHPRGTTNGNVRGNNRTRLARRKWMVETYRADVTMIRVTRASGDVTEEVHGRRQFDRQLQFYVERLGQAGYGFGDYWTFTKVEVVPMCRCYRCGKPLTEEDVWADRIKPGCRGGAYGTPTRDAKEGRTNIRPSCGDCQVTTGNMLQSGRVSKDPVSEVYE